MMAETTDMLVSTFHLMGLHQREIRIYLQNCNIVMSKTTLKRHLKKLGLYRRKNYSDMCDVALFIMAQLNTSDKMLGYRMMHLKCIQEGFVVTHDHVRLLLRILDKEGVQMRKKRQLRRRAYHNLGPNFLWHVDSYDKLKPYGICINGCVDGFSRRVIWLKAWKTSSDPFIIAGYFLEACKKINGCPMRVRTDFGTENVDIANIQRFLRQEDGDEYSGDASFIYGSSTYNQRIESWWGQLRKQNAQYWMNLFQMMKDENIFTGSFLDKSLIQFCFMDLVQVSNGFQTYSLISELLCCHLCSVLISTVTPLRHYIYYLPLFNFKHS